MNVLVINCGSSSLKFSVVETESGKDLAKGLFDRLGSKTPGYKLKNVERSTEAEGSLGEGEAHEQALDLLARFLNQPENDNLVVTAVGHRMVHGGEKFTGAALINDETLAAVESCSALAPLHNPSNLLGVRKSLEHFTDLPQVAVFDTAFHQTLSKEAYLYPIPLELYREHGIRRYGFHGSSHKYVTSEAARILGKPLAETNIITIHLGNGCSAAAIENGRSVDTTMGLTPLEGLVMGTRSGDLDPGIIFHLYRSLGMSMEEIDATLNKKSGLLGLSELSNDMRELRQAAADGNENAKLALAVFERRLAKSVASLRASMSKLDAIVFTGGIGENDAVTRSAALRQLAFLGIEMDADANQSAGRGKNGFISTESSKVKAIVIPTNEELMIARETAQHIAD
ncbi:acetate kinase [Pelagicoccus sp. SDUM812003]|uniref:acetate/propionate family kinase n=1 Tax=Pelagicoccus sp. SDUM812003 TaxID=3041267 RepID=UPI00280D5C8C|nr:acetate kinase [Pelagicoccus sp. SDUM812003]MDQ8201890.1 acetate kinase [Pelagicoccus sp. SDUM812003]